MFLEYWVKTRGSTFQMFEFNRQKLGLVSFFNFVFVSFSCVCLKTCFVTFHPKWHYESVCLYISCPFMLSEKGSMKDDLPEWYWMMNFVDVCCGHFFAFCSSLQSRHWSILALFISYKKYTGCHLHNIRWHVILYGAKHNDQISCILNEDPPKINPARVTSLDFSNQLSSKEDIFQNFTPIESGCV